MTFFPIFLFIENSIFKNRSEKELKDVFVLVGTLKSTIHHKPPSTPFSSLPYWRSRTRGQCYGHLGWTAQTLEIRVWILPLPLACCMNAGKARHLSEAHSAHMYSGGWRRCPAGMALLQGFGEVMYLKCLAQPLTLGSAPWVVATSGSSGPSGGALTVNLVTVTRTGSPTFTIHCAPG